MEEFKLEELKPCPFCGDSAYYSYVGDGEWVVRCFECRAQISRYMGFDYGPYAMKKGLQAVIEMWNKRCDEQKN